jgi:hypothetical protein
VPAGIRVAEDVDRGEADHLALRERDERQLWTSAGALDLERSPLFERRIVLGVEPGNVLPRLQAHAVHRALVLGRSGDDRHAGGR